LTGARLRKHADYQRAYAASRKRQSASMSWFMAPQQPTLQAAEKLEIWGEIDVQCPSGAKARVDSVGFMRGLKPPPPSGLGFSAACLADSPPECQAARPEGPRVGLTVGKVLGKAHERNRIKRRMREALRRHLELLPAGCDLIFHPRRSVLTLEFAKLEAEIVRILEQANAEAARIAGRPAEPSAGQIAPAKPVI
jgi:ribonuclease P protein component